jgi:hexokinase
MEAIRALGVAISTRAASYLAVALYSLYRLERPHGQAGDLLGTQPATAIAYCGAVAEKHTTARFRCQKVLDSLMQREGSGVNSRRLILEAADDSGLLGAAVGAIMNVNQRALIPRL